MRETDRPPGRRPGGARGAPFPGEDELPPGMTIAAWMTSGDVVHLDCLLEADPDPRPGLPWIFVDWWMPI